MTPRRFLTLFVIFVVANSFFAWSFDAWFHLWGKPLGLINPLFDEWIITPLAMAVFAPQILSYAAFDYLEKLRPFGLVESVLVLSLISTSTYAPLLHWIARRRKNQHAA